MGQRQISLTVLGIDEATLKEVLRDAQPSYPRMKGTTEPPAPRGFPPTGDMAIDLIIGLTGAGLYDLLKLVIRGVIQHGGKVRTTTDQRQQIATAYSQDKLGLQEPPFLDGRTSTNASSTFIAIHNGKRVTIRIDEDGSAHPPDAT